MISYVPDQFWITRGGCKTYAQVEKYGKRVRSVRQSTKAVLLSDGESECWVPRSALVSTSVHDVMGLRPWFKGGGDVLPPLRSPKIQIIGPNDLHKLTEPQPDKEEVDA